MAAWEMTTNALMVSFLFELERAIISCTATEGQNSPHLFIRSSKGRWRWKCECGNIIHAREIKLSQPKCSHRYCIRIKKKELMTNVSHTILVIALLSKQILLTILKGPNNVQDLLCSKEHIHIFKDRSKGSACSRGCSVNNPLGCFIFLFCKYQ